MKKVSLTKLWRFIPWRKAGSRFCRSSSTVSPLISWEKKGKVNFHLRLPTWSSCATFWLWPESLPSPQWRGDSRPRDSRDWKICFSFYILGWKTEVAMRLKDTYFGENRRNSRDERNVLATKVKMRITRELLTISSHPLGAIVFAIVIVIVTWFNFYN